MERVDIYHTAKQMIDHHGDKAVERATMNLDLMKDKGDAEGMDVWMLVIAAIYELQSDKPKVVH
jgi:hypothetical protein